MSKHRPTPRFYDPIEDWKTKHPSELYKDATRWTAEQEYRQLKRHEQRLMNVEQWRGRDPYGNYHVPQGRSPEPPHILRIVNHAVDYGQPDYQEDLEWEIIHPQQCERVRRMEDPYLRNAKIDDPIRTYEEYTCAVQEQITNAGLDTLDPDWKSLEPGDYKVEAYSEYHSHTMDYSGGLRLID